MNGESTLYGYLYQAIAAEIEAGRYRFGAPLPSQEALCRQYNVGITTVRRTLKMPEADGFHRHRPPEARDRPLPGGRAVLCRPPSCNTRPRSLRASRASSRCSPPCRPWALRGFQTWTR